MITQTEEQLPCVAWIFPGQGSQEVGMGKQLLQLSARANEICEIAEQYSGHPLRKLMAKGPSDALTCSEVVQPAIVAISCAYADFMRQHGEKPDFVAGHSLGELSALYAAGVIRLEDVLRLACERGRLMSEGPPGGMVAVKNMDLSDLESAVACVTDGTVCLANLNAPSQLVISGDETGLDRLTEILKEKAASDAGSRIQSVRLGVSGAWHSPLVAVANHEFMKRLQCVPFADPETPVAVSSMAQFVQTGKQLQEALCKQMTKPVRWYETVELLASVGVNRFWEVGSGKVLKGLMRRILPVNSAYQVENIGNGRVLKRLLENVTQSQAPVKEGL